MLVNEVQTEQITITIAAAEAVQDLLLKRNIDGYALRVFVSGGGCSGFQYGMALDNNIRDEDMEYEMHGIKVIVDEISIQYLKGASIDYVEELMGGGFKITNPNAVASCGCGNSFRTKDESNTAGSSSGCGCH
ncbi:MAG TPA: iron-sulfur cluster insertion protein ErpA [Anaerolineales bacterium]|nr:iron-sulfur cluster insertion protein ErpA [Anaerolineales bacterium]